MKKHTRIASFISLALIALPAMTSCGEQEEVINLRVLNCEDYICEDPFVYEDEDGELMEFEDCLSGFEQLMEKQGVKVRVIYDTFDTNETMLSSLKTGKSTYDLICPSDYTIQKMLSADMLQKINFDNVPNYTEYGSQYLRDVLDGIEAPLGEQTEKVGDYSVGYMWGTLGVLYNPAKIQKDKPDLSLEQIKVDMADWASLWSPTYAGEMSVKDSMRDTYSVGIMHAFGEEIANELAASGCFDEDFNLLDGKWDEAMEKYNPVITRIFNRSDVETVEKVKKILLELKENVFGFEVDSGKEDIVKGLIGMNTAWSGDATYSIETAAGEQNTDLYYSVPSTGGNIWLDGWVIPKTNEPEDIAAQHKELAEAFLNYLCDPQVAAANMNFIGYTSFVAGDTVHNLIREWYDPRAYEIYALNEDEEILYNGDDEAVTRFDMAVYEDENGLVEEINLPDNCFDKEGELDHMPYEETWEEWENSEFYRNIASKLSPAKEVLTDDLCDADGNVIAAAGDEIELASCYQYAVVATWEADSTAKTASLDSYEVMNWSDYQDMLNEEIREGLIEEGLTGDELEEAYDEQAYGWLVTDLTYMFSGTLEDDSALSTPETNPCLFYNDELEEVTYEGKTVLAGRQFYAQYPDHSMLPKLAIMADYGENNENVLKMWQDVKSNNLPLAGVIVFAIILVGGLAAVLTSFFIKRYWKHIRIQRRKEAAAEREKYGVKK